MDRLREQHDLIEDQISELEQQVHFCINNYDYHHNNSEAHILQKQVRMQRYAHKIFKTSIKKFGELKETLAAAELQCEQVDRLLWENGLVKTEDSARNEKIYKNQQHSSEDEKENH